MYIYRQPFSFTFHQFIITINYFNKIDDQTDIDASASY